MFKAIYFLAPISVFCALPIYAQQLGDDAALERDQKLVVPDQDLIQRDSRNIQSKAIAIPDLQNGDALSATSVSSLEEELAEMILRSDAAGLKEKLKLYYEVENRDDSLIDWGEAIIALSEGRTNDAVSLYRKITSALPDQAGVRLQLAIALFYDRQFQAAKSELEKLRSNQDLNESYYKIIDQFLEAISKQNEWSFSFGASYIYDKNINDSPKKGTKIVYPNGAVVSSLQEPESGKGLEFNFGADKRYQFDNGLFAKIDLGVYGSLYFDNKSYNDLSTRIGIGGGYSNAITEVSVTPFFAYRWYVDSDEDNHGFDFNNKSIGVRTELSQWLSPNLRYQGALEASKLIYRDARKASSGNDYLLSNTILYARNPRQYFFAGLDGSKRKNDIPSQSYRRIGGRLGWGQEWGKGISTRASVGLGRKYYDGMDFFAIKQKSTDYSLSLSVWNRDWHIWDVTPRLTWQYKKVDSNHPFYSNDGNNVFLEFTKTF
ncbi:DUF560 domain-containing protein [Cardiobacteriaceae bacterium TAE3-ERU3]|nr:DUF560 domain-containing protein [Cardiobacteriaceae bacterium TAE3-ERU3]